MTEPHTARNQWGHQDPKVQWGTRPQQHTTRSTEGTNPDMLSVCTNHIAQWWESSWSSSLNGKPLYIMPFLQNFRRLLIVLTEWSSERSCIMTAFHPSLSPLSSSYEGKPPSKQSIVGSWQTPSLCRLVLRTRELPTLSKDLLNETRSWEFTAGKKTDTADPLEASCRSTFQWWHQPSPTSNKLYKSSYVWLLNTLSSMPFSLNGTHRATDFSAVLEKITGWFK